MGVKWGIFGVVWGNGVVYCYMNDILYLFGLLVC